MAGRALWKGPFFQPSLLQAIRASRNGTGRSEIKVTCRNNTIIPEFVGAKLHVHNGKEFVPLSIREDMVGHRIWEYVRTTKPFTFRMTNALKH